MRRYNHSETDSANMLLHKIAKIVWDNNWINHEQACVEGVDEIIAALKTPNKKKDCVNLFAVGYNDLLKISALLNNGKVPVNSSRSDNIGAFCVEKVEEIKWRIYG